jgi:site-specific recombinase XerD
MRETERAAASAIRRRLAALSSLYKYLIRHGHAPAESRRRGGAAGDHRDAGATPAFSKAQARKIPNAPPEDTIAGLRDRAILSVAPQVGLQRAEIAALTVGDLHQNRGDDSLRVTRKRGRRDALAMNPQTAARIRAYRLRRAQGRYRRAAVPAGQAQLEAPGRAPAHGPRRDRPRGARVCSRARARPPSEIAKDRSHPNHPARSLPAECRGRL